MQSVWLKSSEQALQSPTTFQEWLLMLASGIVLYCFVYVLIEFIHIIWRRKWISK